MDTKKLAVHAKYLVKSRMFRQVAVQIGTSVVISKIFPAKNAGMAFATAIVAFGIGTLANTAIDDTLSAWDAKNDWMYYTELHQIEIAR